MYLLNGQVNHFIDVADRGFQYGDGLFETIEVENGVPIYLKQHLERLLKGCTVLKIPPPTLETLKQEAIQLALSAGSKKAVLKLILTRGSGGRGYRQPESIETTRLFSFHPFPEYPESYQQQGIAVKFCQTRLGLNPGLAGIKHLNRLEQVLARSEWNSADIQEGLMLDINGLVIEGTMSNVFIVKNNCLYTPLIQQCGVSGVLRNIIILLARENNIRIVEKVLTKSDIDSANEVFVSNSIIGIWPVKAIENKTYTVGSITQQLQVLLLAFKKEDSHDD